MLDYNLFKKTYLENVYSQKIIGDGHIIHDYDRFRDIIKESESHALDMLTKSGIKYNSEMFDELVASEKYTIILLESVVDFLGELYGEESLDKSGICLIKNLIGRACQMRHDDNLLGVVRGFDRDKPNYLFIDFGDSEDIKVDIDELRIFGQKK